MRIYSESDILRLRERMAKKPSYLKSIEESTANVRRKLYIQQTGIATWGHYFTCPKCGAQLIFDYDNNESFTCSACGSVQSGEPYLGAWWNTILDLNVSAALKLALAYVATENPEYLSVVKSILLGYADNYCNYEVHGGIPYNNPGRFASQVLSDSHPIYMLCLAFDLIGDQFTEQERAHIINDLFRPASEHQLKYLTPQIHNHEVAICASIAVIGLAIGDDSLVEQALNMKYGIKYQLDHAYLADSFWFEGSTAYHLYSLNWFMLYEMAAKNTKYSLFADTHYREVLYRAFLFPRNIYIGNSKTETLNDGGASLRAKDVIYEYAYSYFGTEELLPMLVNCYKSPSDRDNSLYALVYGCDSLPDNVAEVPMENYISTIGSQLCMLRGSDDRYFLFKALPYGGEHDHYDRLGISFAAYGERISSDLGTSSGYGSPLHYGYFKNTASHNTVVINGENMAPCDTVVNEYRVDAPDDIYLDASTLPPEQYTMLDSFTIKQWSDEAYEGVRMRRIIRWLDKYFIDVFAVSSDNTLKKEWTLHVDGANVAPKQGRYVNGISSTGAQSYIKNAYIDPGKGITLCEYLKGDICTRVYALAEGKDMVYAEGPANPANRNLSYLLERSYDKSPVYVNVVECFKGEAFIDRVEASVKDGKVRVTVYQRDGAVKTLNVDL